MLSFLLFFYIYIFRVSKYCIWVYLLQVMCLADLESDYVNPYDSAAEINIIVVPEFVLQGALCFLHLVMGHWLMCLACLPYLYYDVKVYTGRRHLLDVTEIFNQLPWEKKIRLYKLGYLGILLVFSIICMIWSIVAE
ncbi:protein cornichon 4 [Capsicum chacoense]